MSEERKQNFGWTKIRRGGNDELPTGKDAVKIIRTTRVNEYPESTKSAASQIRAAKKPAVTKIAKLSYEPKGTPTKFVIKSIHTYKTDRFSSTNRTNLNKNVIKVDKTNNPNLNVQRSNTNKVINKSSLSDGNKALNSNPKNDIKGLSEKFEQKKQERLQEFNEIRNTLNENLNLFDKKISENIIKENNEVNPSLLLPSAPVAKIMKSSEFDLPVNYSEPISAVDKNSRNLQTQIDHKEKNADQKSAASQIEDTDRHTIPRSITKSKSSTSFENRISKDSDTCNKVLVSGAVAPINLNATSRSKSSTSLSYRTRSKSEKNGNIKTFDPVEARLYMLEQKKRRSLVCTDSNPKFGRSKIQQEEIKKRLENLKQNTRKILDKNIKKTRKKTTTVQNINNSNKNKNPPVSSKKIEKDCNIKSDNLEKISVKDDKKEISVSLSRGSLSQETSKELEKQAPIVRKIGLLRVPESGAKSPTTLQTFDMNKENIFEANILRIQNQVEVVNSSDNPKKNIFTEHADNDRSTKEQDSSSKNLLDTIHIIIDNQSKQSSENKKDLELSVPDVKLKEQTSLYHSKGTQYIQEEKVPSVPYWLKPTPVETYPYSFIMAVRKKLEAIANPVLTSKKPNSDKTEKNEIYKTSSIAPSTGANNVGIRQKLLNLPEFKIPISEIENQIKNNVEISNKLSTASSVYSSFLSSQTKDVNREAIVQKSLSQTKSSPTKGSHKSSKSFSEITSNFSSITLEVPESNTISEVSSIRSESVNPVLSSTKISRSKKQKEQDNDTTISSAIFSSPEKIKRPRQKYSKEENFPVSSESTLEKKLSPLSTQNIDNLTIKSKSIPSSINVTRGDKFDQNFSTDISEKILTASELSNKNQTQNVNFDELLQAFNKSLSQVMEVNEQLHSTLQRKSDNSKSKQSKATRDYYSSDFEEVQSSINAKRSGTSAEEKTISSKHSSHKISSIQSENIAFSHGGGSKTINSTKSSISTVISDYTTRYGNHITSNIPAFSEVVNATMSGTLIETSKDTPKSQNNTSEEFIDSIENARKLFKDPEKPMDLEYSKDSLDILPPIENVKRSKAVQNSINNQINFYRGDIETRQHHLSDRSFSKHSKSSKESLSGPPPGYFTTSIQEHPVTQTINSTIGSDIFAVFNQSDIELSITSKNGSFSEANLSYSSIGVYEKLLSTETSKSQYLTALLKKREKALLDRTRGQIAWLEIQKGECRTKGLIVQITAIKKKQRAILLKMEKEREEIKKILKSSEKANNYSHSEHIRRKLSQQFSDVIALKRKSNLSNENKSNAILKGFEIERNQRLELILKKREEELRKRREHVEKLVEWHKRLDKEEQDVIGIEDMLFKYNTQGTRKHIIKKEQRILEINKSLKILQNISATSEDNEEIYNRVCATGIELNKLWHRLTGRSEIRFDETGRYRLTKEDLEKLYENAKKAVLKNFGQNEKIKFLLEYSNLDQSKKTIDQSEECTIPSLNLSITSNTSEPETIIKPILSDETIPSNREENKISPNRNLSTSLTPASSAKSIGEIYSSKEIFPTISDTDEEEETREKIFEESLPNEAEIVEKISTIESNIQELTDNNSRFATIEPLSAENHVTEEKGISNSTGSSLSSLISTVSSIQKIAEMIDVTAEKLISKKSEISDEKLTSATIESEDFPSENLTPSSTENNNHIESNVTDFHNYQNETSLESRIIDEKIHSSSSEKTENFQSTNNLITDPSLNSIKTDTISEQTSIADDISQNSNNETTISNNRNNFIKSTSEKDKASENNENNYDDDIFESNTLLDDITLPSFEETLDESKSVTQTIDTERSSESKVSYEQKNDVESTNTGSPSELEQRLIDIDESLKDLNETFERVLSPDKLGTPPGSPTSGRKSVDQIKDNATFQQKLSEESSNLKTASSKISEISSTRMPDIISEVEIRRRQLMNNDSNIKQLEQNVPYMFLREIPNKPPPPYVPPAHGSPMTTIFPSEQRIREITFRRTKELYNEVMQYDPIDDGPSILEENITNIYERIILDICKECVKEYQPSYEMEYREFNNYTKPLALFNPPDRLICLQEFVYKRVRKLLAMDKKNNLERNSIFAIGRRKRDHVDEILILELLEEEHKWTNFDLEEKEVQAAIVDEITNDLVNEVIENFRLAYNEKKNKLL